MKRFNVSNKLVVSRNFFACHKDKSLEEFQGYVEKWGMQSWPVQESIAHSILKGKE